MAHLREINVISYYAGKVVASKGLVNVIQLILPFTMSCSFQRESWVGTGTFLSGRAMAGLLMQMMQMNPIGQSPKSTTMPIDSFPGRGSTAPYYWGGNFSRNTLWTNALGQSNDV